MVSPYSAGTFTLQEAPSFAWRTNDFHVQPQAARVNRMRMRIAAGRGLAAATWCWAAAQRRYTTSMARTLDTAIAKLESLPAEEQDRVARWLLDELLDEELWANQFATSQDALSKLAAEARAERAAGETTELDPDKL